MLLKTWVLLLLSCGLISGESKSRYRECVVKARYGNVIEEAHSRLVVMFILKLLFCVLVD